MSRQTDHLAALPEGANLIHIGPQKTGSTAVQSALQQRRQVLREHGVVYPGRRQQYDLEALGFHARIGAPPQEPEAWAELRREASNAVDQRVCVSHEVFGRADDRQIPRITEALGGDRPHVLMAARRYDRYLPSQWQQRVKARRTLTYEEWLRAVLLGDPASKVWQNVWVPHDTVSLARRWADHVGLENLTLVAPDEGDHELLPSVMERLLALPEGVIAEPTTRTNRSMTYAEAELLRHVVIGLTERGMEPVHAHELLRRGMVAHLIDRPPAPIEHPVPPLPQWALAQVATLSDRRIAGLHELADQGLQIVGDLEALRVDSTLPSSEEIEPPATVAIETAIRAAEGMAIGAMRLQRRTRREERAVQRELRQELRRARASAGRADRPRRGPRRKRDGAQRHDHRAPWRWLRRMLSGAPRPTPGQVPGSPLGRRDVAS